MQCPYCNNEMPLGVLEFGMRSKVVWRPKGGQGEIKKIVVKPYDLGYDEIEAYYCDYCKKMILDLGDLKAPEPPLSFMKKRDDGTLTR